MTDLPTLTARGVIYYHQNDERAFFKWLDRMAVVANFEGRGEVLYLDLGRVPTEDDLRELLAFFSRYGIDMAQLAQFRSTINDAWFADPEMCWHELVFGPKGDRDR